MEPALMVASIFYKGDRRVSDHGRGIFDEGGERRLVEADLEAARSLNIPYALDVMISSAEAAEPYLKFASSFNVPIFVDGISPEVRIRSYRKVKELGIQDLAVANAIYPDTGREELEAIRESGIRSAVLVAFDPRDALESMKKENKLKIIREKLLPKAEGACLDDFMIDVVVLDPASIHIAAESLSFLKEHGYKVGCAPANALSFLSKKRYGDDAYPMLISALAYLRMRGADFLIFGPAGRLRGIVKGIALLESFLALEKGVPRDRLKKHPFVILKELQKTFQEISKG